MNPIRAFRVVDCGRAAIFFMSSSESIPTSLCLPMVSSFQVIGVVECWSSGVLDDVGSRHPLLQHSHTPLLRSSYHDPPAVDIEGRAGAIAAFIARQERDERGDFFGFP